METDQELSQVSAGVALNRMLRAYHTFLESAYEMFRLLEAEVTKQGWELIKPGGSSVVTRNGWGSGLARFDWVMNYVGIAFVPKGTASTGTTAVVGGGLRLLLYQLRRLDRAAEEPVVWRADIQVPPLAGAPALLLGQLQAKLFDRIRPADEGEPAGTLEPGIIVLQGTNLPFEGTCIEVPVAELASRDDVLKRLVNISAPATATQPSASDETNADQVWRTPPATG